MNIRLLCGLLLVLAGAACASDPAARDAERLKLYEAHAGAPVDVIRYFGRIDSWTPLGENALALWTRPQEAYLLTLDSCPDLDFANAITVSEQSGRIYRSFDKVTVVGRGATSFPCRIRGIRPLDVKAVRAAERERRKAGEVATATRENG